MPHTTNQTDTFSYLVLSEIAGRLEGKLNTECHYAVPCGEMPLLAWCTPNERVDIVVEGSVDMMYSRGNGERGLVRMLPGDVLRIKAHGWNLPYANEANTLSICCRGEKLGLSYNHWQDGRCISLAKWAMPLTSLNALLLGLTSEVTGLSDVKLDVLLQAISRKLSARASDVSKQKQLFHQILTYMRCHFHESICRESVAEHFYISTSYLSHLFRQHSDIGFNEYINRERFAHARHLLIEKGLRVKQVALESGFVDADYFCRLFKRLAGMTPTQYRQQYISQQHQFVQEVTQDFSARS
ncbi:helix-turn-helix transcriptional regulator [Enterovibrio calviensis]|uniref:helix-turn-helix transcriptional regulator n=1 Tax=Enterovibrio calviensis TaxID=91359 RepID=UPI000482E78D|nr:helix-turn-helix domain-containing protein [Enterovibrio calviensis]